MLGRGSKVYASKTPIKESDLVAEALSVGAFAKSRNMVNLTPRLSDTQQKVKPGLKGVITSTLVLAVDEDDANNAGIDLFESSFDDGSLLNLGIERPSETAKGIMCKCYVNSFEYSEVSNEGEQTVTVGITVDGDLELLAFEPEI